MDFIRHVGMTTKQLILKPVHMVKKGARASDMGSAVAYILISGIILGLAIAILGEVYQNYLNFWGNNLITYVDTLFEDTLDLMTFEHLTFSISGLYLFIVGVASYVIGILAYVFMLSLTGVVFKKGYLYKNVVTIVGYSQLFVLLGVLAGSLILVLFPYVGLGVMLYGLLMGLVLNIVGTMTIFEKESDGFIYILPLILLVYTALSLYMGYMILMKFASYLSLFISYFAGSISDMLSESSKEDINVFVNLIRKSQYYESLIQLFEIIADYFQGLADTMSSI